MHSTMPCSLQVAFCLLFFTAEVISTFEEYDLVFESERFAPRALLLNANSQRFFQLPKEAFTFCFYVYLENKPSQSVTLVSYSSKHNSKVSDVNCKVNYCKEPHTAISIQGSAATFRNVPKLKEWTHICTSWNRTSGEVFLFMNGAKVGRKGKAVKKGYKIGGNGYLVLGQHQYTHNGRYVAVQGVRGRMTQFNVWNRELSAREVNEVKSCSLSGGVIEWATSQWVFYDGVLVQNSTAPCNRLVEEVTEAPCQNVGITSNSAYDLKDGFEDGYPTVVTATPKDVIMPDMKEFTFCFGLVNPISWYTAPYVEYVTEKGDSEISFISKLNPPGLVVVVGSAVVELYGRVPLAKKGDQYCATWSGRTGVLNFYGNGMVFGTRNNTSNNYVVPGNGHVILTQEQKSPLNEKNRTEGFIYKVSDFYMWDRSLSDEDVASFYADICSVRGYLISPNGSTWDVKKHGCPDHSQVSPEEATNIQEFKNTTKLNLRVTYIRPIAAARKLTFTLCAWIYSEAQNPIVDHFISVDRISLKSTENGIDLICNKERHNFPGDFFKAKSWQHFCLSWSGNDGDTKIYVDGIRKVSITGFAVNQTLWLHFPTRTVSVQYAPADKMEPTKGFAFKVTDVNVWDDVLTEEQLKRAQNCSLIQGYMINARRGLWQKDDYVEMRPEYENMEPY